MNIDDRIKALNALGVDDIDRQEDAVGVHVWVNHALLDQLIDLLVLNDKIENT